jgi:ComF family protein
VREAIHGFKYQQEFHLLGPLSDWLEEGFERFFEGKKWSALVPVPLYPLKMRERGFNQAGELARALGRRKGIPVLEALNRVRSTSIQARLRRSERLRNQRGAFACKKGFDGKGMRLLIIDDVFTTGATVDACARALVKAGAEEVHALTVARG